MRFSQRPSRSAILLAVIYSALDTGAADRPKNLVSILTDTHSAWTLGCYGNPDIHTPHIDRLAQEGVRFTWALSSKPVCSPNRATFLTGLMPSQHGVHSFLDPKFLMGLAAYNTLREFTSLGEVLRDAGNTCGLSGKWHCGDNLRPSEGFSFWVTKPDGHTNELCNQDAIEIGEARNEPGYTTDLWTRKGIEFIEQNQTRPFFLFLAYDGPYVLGGLMRNAPRNRHAEFYRGKNFQSFPVEAMHPWQHANKAFHNTQLARERTAAEMSGVDDGMGDVMATLKRLGLEKDTLVVYASDQGWMGGQNGMWGMGDHFRPIAARELMTQIPLNFWQRGEIPPARTSDIMVSNYNFFADGAGASRARSKDADGAAFARARFQCGAPRRDDPVGKRHVFLKWKRCAQCGPTTGNTSRGFRTVPSSSTI